MSQLMVNVSDAGIATITLNRPRTLNALTPEDYNDFAEALRAIDKRDDVIATIWQANGHWFCAGTDVKNKQAMEAQLSTPTSVRHSFLASVAGTTMDCGQAMAAHSKILIAALNGPVMGIAAALLGHCDFIFCMPNAWLSVPFTFIGIIAEGGSSVSFVNRMGVAKANEVLIWGKKKEAQELLDCGFINHIFPQQSTESFHKAVQDHILDELSGLDPQAVLVVKKLIRAGLNEKNNPDAVNLRESFAQAERFASGVPTERFLLIATKQLKHKL